MHPYRTHTCGELSVKEVGQRARLSGWLHRKRDHGNLLFLDLRDHFGITQCVVTADSQAMESARRATTESVLKVTGSVVARTSENINNEIPTGQIEVAVEEMQVLSAAEPLPFPVNSSQDIPEDLRLRYRFLDLRRERPHKNIVLRARIISAIRRRMLDAGFLEFQTPILTSSSPEGARDYLVPSRLHPGKFYALPQAPQQFKQLLMMAGFDRYFQIAPCFRDEDPRADRSPGEFYQLDVEMSFVEQADVFAAIEPVISDVFIEFSDWEVTAPPFPRIGYDDAMLRFGSDKPDLRNPLRISDVTSIFAPSDFQVFANAIRGGAVVRAIPAPAAGSRSRSFFDEVVAHAREIGLGGLAYLILGDKPSGTIAKFLGHDECGRIASATESRNGDAVFFVCAQPETALDASGLLRDHIGRRQELIEERAYRICWIVDYPFYKLDPETNRLTFSHNPFSMPQGGIEALDTQPPLSIRGFQYDIVCNGVELSSGAIRNHRPDVMLRAFEIAGYSREEVETGFGGMLRAFRYGAPPHGGLAPGIDRIVMLLAREPNLREIIAFPMNQRAEDLMMNAPAPATEKQLRELHLKIVDPGGKE